MREARDGYRTPGRELKSPRDKNKVFGGCQIVITGDFAQLRPVKPFRYCMACGGPELEGWRDGGDRPLTCKSCNKTYKDSRKWTFRSKAWAKRNFKCYELHHTHRQTDETFIQILRKFRKGERLTYEERALLTQEKPDPPGAVYLMPRKQDVRKKNRKNYERLPGPEKIFECHDVFSWRNRDETDLEKHSKPLYGDRPNGPLLSLKEHRFDETVCLKVGMLVLLQANVSFTHGLVNGSQVSRCSQLGC